MNMDNLLIRLYKWTSRQDENFLTEAFAYVLRYLCNSEQEVASRVLIQLTGSRLSVAYEDVKKVSIVTQVSTEYGRPDIELQTADHLVYIEAKLESGLGRNQLARYREQLNGSGFPNTSLVILSRYPVQIPSNEESPDVFCRWYKVAGWLQKELDNGTIQNPVSLFLTNQFINFLKQRSIVMDRVGWELPNGVRSLKSLADMLGEAIASCNIQQSTRSGAWEWIGYYLDNKNFFFGINYDRPEILVFENQKLKVRQDSVERVGFGRLAKQKGKIYWFHELDLSSEDVHFYALSKERQLHRVKEFLRKSLDALPKITANSANE